MYSFGAATIWLVLTLGFDASFVFTTVYSKMNSSVLIAIPLFIILGAIMEKGGVGSALVNSTAQKAAPSANRESGARLEGDFASLDAQALLRRVLRSR
ncbi:MAG: TRAP transporter large permease subunit [Clostridiales bacterium]|nr:TRAP transporter large permease subunit [Clostridiales bacterium]